MLSLEESLALYPRLLQPLAAESVAIADAAQRVLAEPAYAAADLPRFDQSAMDGYALRAAHVAGATEQAPVRIAVIGESAAAAFAGRPELRAGSAMRIFTGAVVPDSADTVIPQERATRKADALVFSAPYPAGRNIRYQGEELRAGATIAQAGQRVGAGLLAALINGGLGTLRVRRRPRLAILTTGDELQPPGTPLRPGELPDSNGAMIRAQLSRWGYAPPPLHYVRDREGDVLQQLGSALEQYDLVVTTGGASVGDKDFIPGAAGRLGVETIFWKVAQKPGKPIFFGRKGTALLLGLPGNPASVLVGLQLHLRRILDCLEGQSPPGPRLHAGRLAAAVEADSRTQLLRVRTSTDADGQCWLQPLPGQASHMLSNLAAADAMALVPPSDSTYAAGTVLNWIAL